MKNGLREPNAEPSLLVSPAACVESNYNQLQKIKMKKTTIISVMMAIAITALPQGMVKMDENNPLGKLQIAEMAINYMYVDSVDEGKLVEDAIRGMLEKLDPHSSYSTPKEVKALNEPLAGSFDGIGVQFNMVEDTLLVIQPVTGPWWL